VSAVGLLFPGWGSPREAAPMTLLVGALQVSTPTTLITMGIADARTVFTASGPHLLGFTYLKGKAGSVGRRNTPTDVRCCGCGRRRN